MMITCIIIRCRIGGVFDQTRAAQHFLRKFREGQLGHLTLDTVTSDKILL